MHYLHGLRHVHCRLFRSISSALQLLEQLFEMLRCHVCYKVTTDESE